MAGGLLKSIARIAPIAAAPFTGGTSLLGTLGTIGSVLSAVNSAQSLFGGKDKQGNDNRPVEAAEAPPFSPQKPEEMGRPESLSEFGTFTPEQQRSALATKGLNSGLGSDENSYYKNLVQRSLIGDNNQVDNSNPNFLLPVESQYFSRQGLDTSDIMKFLQGISG
jgi:hypothetical protein